MFKTTATIDESTFIELKKHLLPPREKMHYLITSIAAFALAFAGIAANITDGINSPDYGFNPVLLILIGIPIGIMMPIMYFYRIKKVIQINMDRFREAGYTKIEVVTSFADDKIELHNATTGASSSIKYSAICRFAETENTYTLFTKAEQFVVVNKASLIQEQTNDEFIGFIRKKCRIKSL